MVATLAIALHVVLPAAITAASAAAADPFAVICHGGPAQLAPAGDFAPSKACDHCALCGVASVGLPVGAVPAGQLLPARRLLILMPALGLSGGDILATPRLARAPPQLT